MVGIIRVLVEHPEVLVDQAVVEVIESLDLDLVILLQLAHLRVIMERLDTRRARMLAVVVEGQVQ